MARNIAGKIEMLIKLTDKIGTNKEIVAFIINLFNIKITNPNNPNIKYKNITLQYFNSAKSLAIYLEQLHRVQLLLVNLG